MKPDSVVAMVLVQDMDRALRFYRDTLGFTMQVEQEEWALFAEGVGLLLSPDPLPQDNLRLNAVMVAISVEDVEQTYRALIRRGVAFLVGPTDVGGAMVASFRDSEGNLLQLWQRQAA